MPFYTRDLPIELRGTKSGFQEMARNWRRRECMAIVEELNAKQQLLDDDVGMSTPPMIAKYDAMDLQLQTAATTAAASSTQSDQQKQQRQQQQQKTPLTSFIVTAHTYDDQLETLLMKLVRGVHIANFQPMQTLTDDDSSMMMPMMTMRRRRSKMMMIFFFKPLLQLTKQQLTDYLVVRGLQWREDRSNQDSEQYKRNKVRLQLVPLMSELAGEAICMLY